jgi:hypothetical protein
MDREQEVLHLEQADVHIEKAKQIIDRQLGIIEDLERHGRDSQSAKSQLATYERVLTTMLQHRNISPRHIGDLGTVHQQPTT